MKAMLETEDSGISTVTESGGGPPAKATASTSAYSATAPAKTFENDGKKASSTYKPRPLSTGSITMPDQLHDLVDLLAKNQHDVWAKSKMEQGFHYPRASEISNPSADSKTSLLLVPYDRLSEEDKEKNRVSVMAIIKTMLFLGYKLERVRDHTAIMHAQAIHSEQTLIDEDEFERLQIQEESLKAVKQKLFNIYLLKSARDDDAVMIDDLLCASDGAGAEVTAKDSYGMTALHFCVKRGHLKTADAIIDAGGFSIIDSADRNGFTPLMLAAYLGNESMVSLLLQRGARLDACDHAHKLTSFHIAAYNGNTSACRLLAKEHHESGVNINEVFWNVENDEPNTLVSGLDGGSSSSFRLSRKRTNGSIYSLFSAADSQDDSEFGMDDYNSESIRARRGYSPLALAVKAGRVSIVVELNQFNQQSQNNQKGPLHRDGTGKRPYFRALRRRASIESRRLNLEAKLEDLLLTERMGASKAQQRGLLTRICPSCCACIAQRIEGSWNDDIADEGNAEVGKSSPIRRRPSVFGAKLAAVEETSSRGRKKRTNKNQGNKRQQEKRDLREHIEKLESDKNRLDSIIDAFNSLPEIKGERQRYGLKMFLKQGFPYLFLWLLLVVFVVGLQDRRVQYEMREFLMETLEDSAAAAIQDMPSLIRWHQMELFGGIGREEKNGTSSVELPGSENFTLSGPSFITKDSSGEQLLLFGRNKILGAVSVRIVDALPMKCNAMDGGSVTCFPHYAPSGLSFDPNKFIVRHAMLLSRKNAFSALSNLTSNTVTGGEDVDDRFSATVQVTTEINVYNEDVKVYGNILLQAQFRPTGDVDMSAAVTVLSLTESQMSPPSYPFVAVLTFVSVITLLLLVSHVRRADKAFSILSSVVLALMFAILGLNVFTLREAENLRKMQFDSETFTDSVRLVSQVYAWGQQVSSVAIFFLFIPIIWSFRFIDDMLFLKGFGSTFVSIFGSIFHSSVMTYLIILLIIFMWLAAVTTLMYGGNSLSFATYATSFEQLFRVPFAEEFGNVSGNSEIQKMFEYMYLLISMIIVNLFIAILITAYEEKREVADKVWSSLIDDVSLQRAYAEKNAQKVAKDSNNNKGALGEVHGRKKNVAEKKTLHVRDGLDEIRILEGNDGFIYTRSDGRLKNLSMEDTDVATKGAHELFESSGEKVLERIGVDDQDGISTEGWKHVENRLKMQQEKISSLKDKIGALEENLVGVLGIARETLNINKELFDKRRGALNLPTR
eukprot:g4651.t1